jgi:hypothetical protein
MYLMVVTHVKQNILPYSTIIDNFQASMSTSTKTNFKLAFI